MAGTFLGHFHRMSKEARRWAGVPFPASDIVFEMQLLFFVAMKDMSELVWEDLMTSPIWLPGSSVWELLIEE